MPPQEYPLAPLEDDCKLLGALLDDCLKIEVGDELFQKVSRTCHATLSRLLAVGSAEALVLSLLRCILSSGSVDPAARAHLLLSYVLTEGHAAQVERIRSLAQCASDLSKKHDVVGAVGILQTMVALCLLSERTYVVTGSCQVSGTENG